LDLCDFIKYFHFQGDLEPGKEDEFTGGQNRQGRCETTAEPTMLTLRATGQSALLR